MLLAWRSVFLILPDQACKLCCQCCVRPFFFLLSCTVPGSHSQGMLLLQWWRLPSRLFWLLGVLTAVLKTIKQFNMTFQELCWGRGQAAFCMQLLGLLSALECFQGCWCSQSGWKLISVLKGGVGGGGGGGRRGSTLYAAAETALCSGVLPGMLMR